MSERWGVTVRNLSAGSEVAGAWETLPNEARNAV